MPLLLSQRTLKRSAFRKCEIGLDSVKQIKCNARLIVWKVNYDAIKIRAGPIFARMDVVFASLRVIRYVVFASTSGTLGAIVNSVVETHVCPHLREMGPLELSFQGEPTPGSSTLR